MPLFVGRRKIRDDRQVVKRPMGKADEWEDGRQRILHVARIIPTREGLTTARMQTRPYHLSKSNSQPKIWNMHPLTGRPNDHSAYALRLTVPYIAT